MTMEYPTQIVIFIIPGADVLGLRHGHIVQLQYFFSCSCLYWARIRQIKYIVMMTTEGSTKIVNFMTPGAWVLMLYKSF